MSSEFNRRTGRFYDHAGRLYPLIEPWLRRRRRRVLARVNAEPAGRLLEIGVGPGRHWRGDQRHRVTAVDVSERMVELARSTAGADGVEVLRMDGESLEFEGGRFDYVLLLHVLSVTEDAGRMMREVHRVLRAGGRAYILNHETPRGAARHWDRVAGVFSGVLRLRMWFRAGEVPGIEVFRVIERQSLGLLGYHQLLILEK